MERQNELLFPAWGRPSSSMRDRTADPNRPLPINWGSPMLKPLLLLCAFSLSLTATARAQSDDNINDRIFAEYRGRYFCAQGNAAITLQLLLPDSADTASAIFKFGPDDSIPNVPDGAFFMTGSININSDQLHFQPRSWLSQPPHYVMVGLEGVSRDAGRTFTGRVVGSGCSSFSIARFEPSPIDPREQFALASKYLRGATILSKHGYGADFVQWNFEVVSVV
jgi:hypothetical protein